MTDYIVHVIQNPSLLSVFLAYLGGVLASLTPCVYPMIPIILVVIGASAIQSRVRGLMLSLAYVAGLSVVYTLFGLFASVTGGFFGEIATSPWSYLIFGNLCIVLGIWMMDWINLPIFSSGKTRERKGCVGAFVIGLLSGVVAAPCTSPVLAGLLIYVSTTKNAAFGGAMMFAFSIGMSTLLILIGTFSGLAKSLPTPGNWTIWVKKGLAVALFVMGEYFLMKAGGLLL
jgi:thiol:disulfide interchange protein DsbD